MPARITHFSYGKWTKWLLGGSPRHDLAGGDSICPLDGSMSKSTIGAIDQFKIKVMRKLGLQYQQSVQRDSFSLSSEGRNNIMVKNIIINGKYYVHGQSFPPNHIKHPIDVY
jgi:hypothetical protein